MNAQLIDDDIFSTGLAAYVQSVRDGTLSVSAAVGHCLRRIEQLDPKLRAFEYLAAEQALARAAALDKALQRGENPGPLAGVPIGVKDIFSVNGMPTTNGSLHPNAHLNGSQGQVIDRLEAAGCVILGKTRTVEYALGATGVNAARGTPRNPWDASTERMPGGSSSGSAVAVAAGMCAFALGSDTGGSIRNPACLTGLVGYKSTVGRWPVDGIFPLSSTLDSAGPLCRSVADAALIEQVVSGQDTPAAPAADSLRLGRPGRYFFADLDTAVARDFELAERKLRAAGVTIVDFDIPEAQERDALFPLIVPPELISQLTVSGFETARPDMDTITAMRAARGLEVLAAQYLQAQARLRELRAIAARKLQGLDGWIMPTCPFTAISLDSIEDGSLHERALSASRNTMPINLFGLCAVTLPTAQLAPAGAEGQLPTGLQLVAAAGDDTRLLGMAHTLESLLGQGGSPELSGFLG